MKGPPLQGGKVKNNEQHKESNHGNGAVQKSS